MKWKHNHELLRLCQTLKLVTTECPSTVGFLLSLFFPNLIKYLSSVPNIKLKTHLWTGANRYCSLECFFLFFFLSRVSPKHNFISPPPLCSAPVWCYILLQQRLQALLTPSINNTFFVLNSCLFSTLSSSQPHLPCDWEARPWIFYQPSSNFRSI